MNFTGGRLFFARVSLRRLGQPRLLHELDQADLRRLVSVFRGRLVLRDHARTSLQHGDRANIALRVKQLRHPDFLAENSRDLRCHFLLHSQLGSQRWLLAGELLARLERASS